jgi:hypothetical protein
LAGSTSHPENSATVTLSLQILSSTGGLLDQDEQFQAEPTLEDTWRNRIGDGTDS